MPRGHISFCQGCDQGRKVTFRPILADFKRQVMLPLKCRANWVLALSLCRSCLAGLVLSPNQAAFASMAANNQLPCQTLVSMRREMLPVSGHLREGRNVHRKMAVQSQPLNAMSLCRCRFGKSQRSGQSRWHAGSWKHLLFRPAT